MKPAFLLVDLQRDYLAAAGIQPSPDILIARTKQLLEACRQRNIPIIHVWTTIRREEDRRLPHWKRAGRWQCVAGSPGHEPPAPLQPVSGEAIIHKAGFNTFADGTLDATLTRLGCDTLIIAGLHLHACVRTVAVEGLERGLAVHIADNAVASNDSTHAAATRRWLAERCVVFEPVTAIIARLDGVSPGSLKHHSPRQTNEVLFEVPVAGCDEVAEATAAARAAWSQWRSKPLKMRLELLEDIAHRVEQQTPTLARQMAVEIGKPVSHGTEEVHRAIANIRDVVRRAAMQPVERTGATGTVRDAPHGVVGLISAWNNPVAIPLGKLSPALAFGNTVVWKPAPAATRIAQTLLQLIGEAGLPADTVRLVTGDHTTAQRLAADRNVDVVTLTGSLEAGHAIQEICSRRFVPLQAELSGNNAAIVWEDADFTVAASQVAWGAFAFAGQRCTANRRVIVRAKDCDRFLEELKTATERLQWGEPLESKTDLGPVISTSQRDEVNSLLNRAQDSGAARRVIRTHASLAREPWVLAGSYLQPAIACCDQPEHPLVQEESMAPLLLVQCADDFDHALKLCNGVRHGLIASLFSNSSALQKQFLDEACAGILKLNSCTAGVDVTLPFGGWKASGIGPPEHGEADRFFHTRTQVVYGGEQVR